jgi:hypothetical protein
MARVFAVQVQILLSITSVAIQSLISSRVLVPVQDVLNEHWRGRGISITDLSYVQK